MGHKKAKTAPSETGEKKLTGREVTQFKPGNRANPNGRPPGARDSLTTLFLRDLKKSWEQFGVSALVAAAWTDPLGYVRVVASLVPKEIEVTVTQRTADQVDDDRLAAIATSGSDYPAEAQEGAEILQPVGSAFRH